MMIFKTSAADLKIPDVEPMSPIIDAIATAKGITMGEMHNDLEMLAEIIVNDMTLGQVPFNKISSLHRMRVDAVTMS